MNLTTCTNRHEEKHKAMCKIRQRLLMPSKYSLWALTFHSPPGSYVMAEGQQTEEVKCVAAGEKWFVITLLFQLSLLRPQ